VSGLGGAVYDGNILDNMQRLVNICDLETLKDGEYAVGFVEVVMD